MTTSDGRLESMLRLIQHEGADAASLTEALAASSPRAQLLMQLLEQQKSVAAEAGSASDDEAAQLDQQRRERSQGLSQRIKRALTDAREEVVTARERLSVLAAALGACDSCWGEDESCRRCHGRGEAGYFEPDAALFRELVAPAIERLRATNPGRSGPATGSSGPQR